MNPLSPFRKVWPVWPIRAKTKPRHILNWWPWPRSTTPQWHEKEWHEPAFLPVIWRLLPEENDPTEYEIRLAKLAIANGLTLEGYRDPDFVAFVQNELRFDRMIEAAGPIKSIRPEDLGLIFERMNPETEEWERME